MDKKLLLISDEKSMTVSLGRILAGHGYALRSSPAPEPAMDQIKDAAPHVVISELDRPGMEGTDWIGRIKAVNPLIQVVLIAGPGSIDVAVAAMKKGAYDFIPKPFNRLETLAKVDRAFEKASLLEENLLLKRKLERGDAPAFDTGRSRVYRSLIERASQAAASDAAILISGEPGSGKEALARHIFAKSNRYARPFVAVNCAAIPENLFDARLFGHGAFQDAEGGTLFLDEVGEIPLAFQPKLLRALQEGVEGLGGERRKADVRIIASASGNLRKQAEEGLFREDLFHRLNAVPLQIPPLRQRPEDLHSLISRFIALHCGKHRKSNLSLSAEALKLMEGYRWPGNVRELGNAVERAVALCRGHRILPEDLPDGLSAGSETSAGIFTDCNMTLEEIELSAIRIGLKRNHGDKAKTAEDLGISLRTIYRKLGMLSAMREEDAAVKTDNLG